MDLLHSILTAQGGQSVKQLAQNFGLEPRLANAALAQLVPALAGGLRSNLKQDGGLEALLGALERGNHAQYLDDASRLARPETVQDGNAILGHVLGNKRVSRQVAAYASQNTGVDVGVLKQMLPVVAAMAMGAMTKQAAGGATGGVRAEDRQASVGGLLAAFLDTNKDGSAVDDVLGMLFKR